MSIIDTINNFSKSHSLFEDKALIVGCSGGSDSVALLRILLEITNNDIYVVHVNHNLRGASSDEDERFVVSLCKELNVPCEVYSFDVKKKALELKRSIEDTGRILRYQAFSDYQNELFGTEYLTKSVICLAHHKDDVAETMLMNLMRGSGLDGLIAPKAKTSTVIRPLLCVTKNEILSYLSDIKQVFRTDLTNFEEECTRNVWRNSIIPIMNEVSNKTTSDALFSTYELLSDDLNYLSGVSDEVFSKTYDIRTKSIDLSSLDGIHRAIATRVIRTLWLSVFGDLTDLEKVHVDDVFELFVSKKPSGTTIDLPFNRVSFVVDGRGGFCQKKDFADVCKTILGKKGFLFCENNQEFMLDNNDINNSVLPQYKGVLSVEIIENSNDIRYNTNSWFYPVFDGETISDLRFGCVDLSLNFGKAGSNTHKVISRLLMDKKVPVCIRSKVFGITKGAEVLWVPGLGHSDGFVDEISSIKFYEANCNQKTPVKILKVTVNL